MTNEEKEIIEEICDDHVQWFLDIIKPMLFDFMFHGFKHGISFKENKNRTSLKRAKRRKTPLEAKPG